MKEFRIIRSQPANACYNMAFDERILARYLEDRVPVLRLYRWRRPSFTCGVSQRPETEIDFKKCISGGIEVVKRMTGGGILFHNDEITYSFACDKQDVGEPQEMFVSYRQICAFLIRFYASLGLKASFACELNNFKDKSAPHELCSVSYEKYDIVVSGKKIGGNAQKRKRSVVFQHGSIPCSIDWSFVGRYLKSLPEDTPLGVTTLCEELEFVPDKSVLEDKLIEAFSKEFGVYFIEEKEPLYETSMAR